MFHVDTIAAISTSVGQAGIGIIRLSGPASVKIARAVFRSFRKEPIDKFTPRKLTYGIVVDPTSGEKIDEALFVYMPKPHSYTCEDVVEIQTHGSVVVLRQVLLTILQEGARLAEPGEFTQRAFLNGRIDLIQAEAVMGVIQSKTVAALRVANEQLNGTLSKCISDIRVELLDLVARIEAALDYPDEEIETLSLPWIEKKLVIAFDLVKSLLSNAKMGKIYREGVLTVIVGRPNVGKSTLLNALLGEDRALVSPIPGTTRDTIEEFVNLQGIPLRIVDTAGLRETTDQIEKLGINRTREHIQSAGLVLYLLDASEFGIEDDLELLRRMPDIPIIIVVNKMDLPQLYNLEKRKELIEAYPMVPISAKDKTGFDLLQKTIEKMIFSEEVHLSQSVCIDNVRHVASLLKAQHSLDSAIVALQKGFPVDCILIDVRSVLLSLGQITGESVSDEVVREIFSKFCLGK